MRCPDANQLVDYVEGHPGAEQVSGHLDVCAECSELAADLARAGILRAPRVPDPEAERAAAPVPRELEALRRGARVDRFVLEELIGVGGMGRVYRAFDPVLRRPVALKVVSRTALADAVSPEESAARMLGEAQAMASIAHPNVVAVYEVGRYAGGVFLAMEHVEGTTLREWLAASPREPREILQLFAGAGRGLAAAHAAGIIHRDFKPENVMVGGDGRARVTDFGLAHARAGADRATGIEGGALPAGGPGLTRTGTLLGTPAYMAPEQLARRPVDARTDQFSFCAALYEALYGRRPFEGSSIDELAARISTGQLRPPPRRRGVSATTRRALLRGLAAEPGARFPSMNVLLEELARDAGRTWRRALSALAALGVLAAWAYAAGHSAQPCEAPDPRLERAWGPGQRAALRSAFTASQLPYARDALMQVEPRLDALASAWESERREACTATLVRREQSQAVLDLRMACLDQRLEEMEALVEVLARADGRTIEHAVSSVYGLRLASECTPAEALRASALPPPPAGAQAAIEQVRQKLARARALEKSGHYGDGLPIAQRAADQARAIGYAPLRAEALYLSAVLDGQVGNFTAADGELEEALLLATSVRDDRLAAQAWIQRIFIVGSKQADARRAAELTRHAKAALDRLGRDEALLARFLLHRGLASHAVARYEEALADFRLAEPLFERTSEPGDPERATILSAIGIALSRQGRYAEAHEVLVRALTVTERTLGTSHPRWATLLTNLGRNYSLRGDVVQARTHLERARDALERSVGPHSPLLVPPLSSLAKVYVDQKDLPRARRSLEWVLAIQSRTQGANSVGVAATLANIGIVLDLSGDPSGAREHFERSLSVFDQIQATQSPDRAYALTGLGRLLLATGDLRRARRLLEEALGLREGLTGDAAELAETRFALARVLWALGEDRERAIALAEAAADAYRRGAASEAPELEEVVAWLRVYRRARGD